MTRPIKKPMQVYSHNPCEKSLMEKVVLNRAKDLFISGTGAIVTGCFS